MGSGWVGQSSHTALGVVWRMSHSVRTVQGIPAKKYIPARRDCSVLHEEGVLACFPRGQDEVQFNPDLGVPYPLDLALSSELSNSDVS